MVTRQRAALDAAATTEEENLKKRELWDIQDLMLNRKQQMRSALQRSKISKGEPILGGASIGAPQEAKT